MLICEITSSDEQLNLLKLISNCTWSAIQQQKADLTTQPKKVKPKRSRSSSIKITAPPPPPPPPKKVLPTSALNLGSQEQMNKVKQMFDKLKPKEADARTQKNTSQ
jgi:hypothetical protein